MLKAVVVTVECYVLLYINYFICFPSLLLLLMIIVFDHVDQRIRLRINMSPMLNWWRNLYQAPALELADILCQKPG